MKKIVSLLLVCVMLVSCIGMLASCGKKLSGTYKLGSGVAGATYEFDGSKVTVTASLIGIEKSFEGTYEITENDKEETVIIFTFENDEAETYDGEFAFAEGKEGDTEYIKIGGIKYVKEKK